MNKKKIISLILLVVSLFAIMGLVNATEALVSEDVDFSVLDGLVAQVEGLSSGDYSVDSWAVLDAVLGDAKGLDRDNVSQVDVDALVVRLNAAIDGLVPVSEDVDFSALDTAIAKADSLTKTDYSADSWAALVKTLSTAKSLDRDNASQIDVDALVARLNAAISNLKKPNVDLRITKVVRSGNTYKITIKNYGNDKSAKTKLKVWFKKNNKTYYKIVDVKTIAGGKSLTINVKFFKYSTHKKLTKTAQVNYNKMAYETNYNNNLKKFKV